MGQYDYLAYDKDYAAFIKQMEDAYLKPYTPEIASSPTPTLEMLYGGKDPMLQRQPKQGFDPWSVGLTAAGTAAPMVASLLGRSPMPGGFDSAPSLGMTKGLATVLNAYAGKKPARLKALLAQYLRR